MENFTEAPALNATLPTWTGASTEYKVVSTVLTFAVCALGIVGNVMVILVVLTTKHMKTPTNCYLVSLAAADLMVLTAAGMTTSINTIVGGWAFGPYGCAGITYFQYLGINASSASITAFTVERYIAICHPIRAQSLCTNSRAKKIIAVLWTLTSVYCTMWLYLAHIEEVVYANVTVVTCGYRVARKYYMPIYFVDFGVFFVAPLLLSSVMYALIARVLYLNPLLSTPKDKHRKPEDAEAEGGDADDKRANCSNSRHSSCAAASRRQVTKMLAVVVILFALLWMPYRTLVVVNSFIGTPYVNRDLLLFCRLCIYLNSAINPIIYNAMSQKFRAAFRKLCQCGRRAAGRPRAYGVALTHSGVKDTSLGESTDHFTLEPDELTATDSLLSEQRGGAHPNGRAADAGDD